MNDRPKMCLGCSQKQECTLKKMTLEKVESFGVCKSCPLLESSPIIELDDSHCLKNPICPFCHTHKKTYLESSLLHCDQCVEVFEQAILENLKKRELLTSSIEALTSANQSLFVEGKEKTSGSIWVDLSDLYQRMRDAIAKEDYEKAAKIRDEIQKAKQRTCDAT